MKGFLWAAGTLAIVLVLVIVNGIFVQANIRQTEREIEALAVQPPGEKEQKQDITLSAAAVREVRLKWEKRLALISLTVNHNDLMAVEEQFATLEGAAEAQDPQAYIVALSVLRQAMTHLGELAGAGVRVLF